MTNEQKKRVTDLRQSGYGLSAIAENLGISRDTIKSFCRRNKIIPQETLAKTTDEETCFCRECGKKLIRIAGHRRAFFCSAECRVKWWNSHPEKVNKKAVYSFTCAHCGNSFSAYGNAHRKYCSHACYIADRFKGGDSSD